MQIISLLACPLSLALTRTRVVARAAANGAPSRRPRASPRHTRTRRRARPLRARKMSQENLTTRSERAIRGLAARDAARATGDTNGFLGLLAEALARNALDAGATRAAIAVRIPRPPEGITVVSLDDGAGMSREDARELARALEATDGAARAADRAAGRRRGRALRGVVATCGEVEIVTRLRDGCETTTLRADAGTGRVTCASGAFDERWSTRVTCREVFQSNAVALARAREDVRKGALVKELRSMAFHACLLRPSLSMEVSLDGRVIERFTNDRTSVLDGLRRAYGEDVVKWLRIIDYESAEGGWRVRGYVNSPARRLGSPDMQLVYVNGELIKGKSAIHKEMIRIEASAYLGDGTRKGYAGFLLSIECPDDAYEVTYDPTVTLIEFFDWTALLSLLAQAVVHEQCWPVRDDPPEEDEPLTASERCQLIPSTSSNKRERCTEGCCGPTNEGPLLRSMLRRRHSRDANPSNAVSALETWTNPVFNAPETPIMSVEKSAPTSWLRAPATLEQSALFACRVIDQIGAKFVIAVVADVIVAFDQHACDERIGLEELWAQVLGPKQLTMSEETQPALWATPLSLDEFQTLTANADVVRRWGWDYRTKPSDGPNCESRETLIYLTRVPAIRGTTLGGDALRQFLHQLATTKSSRLAPQALHRLLASKACRGAIMFGDELTKSECECIINALRLTQMPFACAHGRPTCAPLARLPLPGADRQRIKNIPNIRSWIRSRPNAAKT